MLIILCNIQMDECELFLPVKIVIQTSLLQEYMSAPFSISKLTIVPLHCFVDKCKAGREECYNYCQSPAPSSRVCKGVPPKLYQLISELVAFTYLHFLKELQLGLVEGVCIEQIEFPRALFVTSNRHKQILTLLRLYNVYIWHIL